MTKHVIEREQSIMGTIFFIFKVNTVEKVLRDLFQLGTVIVPLNPKFQMTFWKLKRYVQAF